MKFAVALSVFSLLASVACAQAVDWKSLGKPLDDDTKPMLDRYVYVDQTTTDKNVGIDKPVLAPNEINDWVTQRVPELFALKSTNYDQTVIVNQKHFTPTGYGQYIASMNAAQLPTVVKDKRYSVTAVVTDPVNITAKGLRDESDKSQPDAKPKMVYVWMLEVPISMNYQGASVFESKSYKVMVKMELVRIPMKEDGTLISINAWSLEEYKSTLLNPGNTQ